MTLQIRERASDRQVEDLLVVLDGEARRLDVGRQCLPSILDGPADRRGALEDADNVSRVEDLTLFIAAPDVLPRLGDCDSELQAFHTVGDEDDRGRVCGHDAPSG